MLNAIIVDIHHKNHRSHWMTARFVDSHFVGHKVHLKQPAVYEKTLISEQRLTLHSTRNGQRHTHQCENVEGQNGHRLHDREDNNDKDLEQGHRCTYSWTSNCLRQYHMRAELSYTRVRLRQGMATSVTIAHHFIWRHLYASMQAVQIPANKLRFVAPDKESSINTLWQEEEFEQICSRESLTEKAVEIEKRSH